MKVYFIHYTYSTWDTSGSGNIDVTVEGNISSIEDIVTLQEGLKDQLKISRQGTVIITNFILLSEKEEKK